MVGSVTERLAPDRNFLVMLNGTNLTEVNITARDSYRVQVAAATTVLGGLIQVIKRIEQLAATGKNYTIQHNTRQHNVLDHALIQCNPIQHDTRQHNVLDHALIQCIPIQHDTRQYNMLHCTSIQSIQFKSYDT
jgi:hypothetical protein